MQDYRVNLGLYVSRGDIKERLVDVSAEQLNKLLTSLEGEGLRAHTVHG